MSSNKDLENQIDQVFNIKPRVETRSLYWYTRAAAYKELSKKFNKPGSLVCVYGPTGSGKTSLTRTLIVRERIQFLFVQITKNMDWYEFCRQVITKPQRANYSLGGDLEIGIQNGLPSINIGISISEEDAEKKTEELHDLKARTWTEHEVANIMNRNECALVIDDVDRSNDELLSRITDLCKILTDTYSSDKARIMIIGAGDILHRIYNINRSLDKRIYEICLGAFNYSGDSWKFISGGLDKLGLDYPKGEYQRINSFEKKVWEAAGGFPKSLNYLGNNIANHGLDRPYIIAKKIKQEAETMIKENYAKYKRNFIPLIPYIKDDEVAFEIVRYIYYNGVGRIHYAHQIINMLLKKRRGTGLYFAQTDIDSALDKLIELEFIYKTGNSSDLIFVCEPEAAHSIGVNVRSSKSSSNTNMSQRDVSKAFPIPRIHPEPESEPE